MLVTLKIKDYFRCKQDTCADKGGNVVFVPMLFVYLNIMHILQFSGNTFQSQRVLASIHNLTQSHTAEIEIIKGDIDAERQKREISFDDMTRNMRSSW